MDDPVKDIGPIVHLLTQGSPKEQETTINTYFTPNASFTHPFCRTFSFNGSRLLIHAIFRWYKIMSPQIHLHIDSIAFDQSNLLLYITITQTFAIWFVPFHRSPVTLTTVLSLTQPPSQKKYYIQSQNDLYQVDQFVRFFLPWNIGRNLVFLWHSFATLCCVVLAVVFAPFTWLEQSWAERRVEGRVGAGFMGAVERVEEWRLKGSGGDSGAEGAGEALGDLAERVRGAGEGVDGERGRLGGFGSMGEEGDKMQFGNMQVVKPN